MPLRFGTDGVRGVANRELTPELVTALGRAAVRVLGADRPYVVGRDTRRSGPMLEAALGAGLCAEGADVEVVGVLPTPGVAHLAERGDRPAAVVSASHNPFADNGIKLFARGGRKLPDHLEAEIEACLRALVPDDGQPVAAAREVTGAAVGAVSLAIGSVPRYVAHLCASIEGRRLDGVRVVLDCANGAATTVAPSALRELGAVVTVLHAEPDGTNINEGCGSTHPDDLSDAVVTQGAQVGLAFDGDADRVVAVDERGGVVDGDQMLAILALDRRSRGRLPGDAIVATVMSNLGLARALEPAGIAVVRTPVGDRHVLEALATRGLVLGGEQSGHLVQTDLATTGDGALAGITLLDAMVRSGRPLSELAAVVERSPQVLRNVAVDDPASVAASASFAATVRQVEAALGDGGRVVVRPSGTEPVLRVMVEASTAEEADAAVERVVAAACVASDS